MQPGMQAITEADILAATQSLQVRKDLKLAQMAALQGIQECLGCYDPSVASGATAAAVSVYLGHLISEHGLDAKVIDSQIEYNNRALAAYRSSILLPTFGPPRSHN